MFADFYCLVIYTLARFCNRALGFVLVHLVTLSLLTHAVRVVKLFQLCKVENSASTSARDLQLWHPIFSAAHVAGTSACILMDAHFDTIMRPGQSGACHYSGSLLEFQEGNPHLESDCVLQRLGKNMQKDATHKSAHFSCIFTLMHSSWLPQTTSTI